MPRNKSLLKGNAAAPGGHRRHTTTNTNASSKQKIIIKPFSKPPSLPPNFYEQTTQELLQGTIAVLQHQLQQKQELGHRHSNKSSSSATATASAKAEILSLQHSYTAVVRLVRHQYGPMLYQDLRASMQQAAQLVLPSSSSLNDDRNPTMSSGGGTTATSSSTSSSLTTLQYVNAQYQLYLDYLLLCKHVFLPLDNSHSWQPSQQAAVATTGGGGGTGGGGTSSSSNANSAASIRNYNNLMTVWQVGLEQFGARLVQLGLNVVLYKEWTDALLLDWNNNNSHTNPSYYNTSISSSGYSSSNNNNSNSDLQAVWYLWQDLGWLPTLPLQRDLEEYWKKISVQWKEDATTTTTSATAATVSYYRAAQFLQFAHDKHSHVTSWPWLPSLWLWSILEICLLQPHLHSDYLLKKEHLYPILQQELTTLLQQQKQQSSQNASAIAAAASLLHQNTTTSSTSKASSAPATRALLLTPTQQLWMLAGRLPNGQQSVAVAIAGFAREQGLQKMSLLQPPPPAPAPAPQAAASQQPMSSGKSVAASASAAATLITNTAAASTQAVNDILELQDGLHCLLATLPHGTEMVHLKNTWEEVVNVDTTPPLAECLAKFLDQLLRNNKRMDQYQSKSPDQWLQRIISGIFVPLQAKDVFEAFYKRDLAKRLLLNRVVSMDIEKQVCSLLKAECGAGYTSKMEGMFQDIDWSRETMMVYKQATTAAAAASAPTAMMTTATSSTSNINSVEMEVQVLTTGYWPVYPQYPNLHLPDALQEPQDRFETHYKTKYQGRRMTWQYALGQCTVRVNGFPKTYELTVGLCQALVLTQFTTAEVKWTLPALLKAVGLEDRDEMERILQSLSKGKEGTRILQKLDHDRNTASSNSSSDNKKKKPRSNVDDKDEFIINASFDSNQRRIRINNIMMKETKEEREKTVETVSRDRLYLIDAVLVRIMKARKTIAHQALIPQVLEQVKVPALAADVKKRIESLIEREYMERDAKDRNRYNYLA